MKTNHRVEVLISHWNATTAARDIRGVAIKHHSGYVLMCFKFKEDFLCIDQFCLYHMQVKFTHLDLFIQLPDLSGLWIFTRIKDKFPGVC